MIKKIICPVDFSASANNAVEYAAKLAQVFTAELLLVNVERVFPVTEAVSLGNGINATTRENARLTSSRLKELSEEAARAFKISTAYEVEVTTKSLAKTLSSLEEKNTMIVMGTNGADDLFQFFFGSNTYNVIKKAECPVLLVPEECPYSTYRNILYALTYEEKGKLALKQLYDFSENFNANITFLHISNKDTAISRDVFNAMQEEVEEYFGNRKNLEFRQTFSDDVEEGLENVMNSETADLLVMAARHRTIAESIFRKRSLLSQLSATAPFPILVLHS